jgi:hypothetical protein
MMLLIAGLMLAAIPRSDLGPSELVERLGSARASVRDEAARTLEEIGADSLPALRRASREADDAEVRARASAVLDRIEGGLLTRPSLVSLDFDGVPLEEAVLAISKRSGHALALDPEAGADFRRRPIRLVRGERVPLWGRSVCWAEGGMCGTTRRPTTGTGAERRRSPWSMANLRSSCPMTGRFGST